MRKLLSALVTLVLSMVVMFLVIQGMPGNPVETLAAEISRTQNVEMEIAMQRAINQLNYDPNVPTFVRLVRYVGGIARGNLGNSLVYQKPVKDVMLGALPWTLLVLTVALLLSFAVGVLVGIYIAWKQKRFLNNLLTIYQSIFGSIPDYIIAYLLIFVFAVTLGWLPSRGPYSATITPGPTWAFISSVLQHALLPIAAYFVTTVANWAINMKASALSALGEDYVAYATARGLSRRRILTTYVGRNSILPLVTNLAIAFGMMFGGSPIIENLFMYPGVGYFLNNAISRRDYPLMQGMYFVMMLVVLLAGLVAEWLYTVLNPRLRER